MAALAVAMRDFDGRNLTDEERVYLDETTPYLKESVRDFDNDIAEDQINNVFRSDTLHAFLEEKSAVHAAAMMAEYLAGGASLHNSYKHDYIEIAKNSLQEADGVVAAANLLGELMRNEVELSANELSEILSSAATQHEDSYKAVGTIAGELLIKAAEHGSLKTIHMLSFKVYNNRRLAPPMAARVYQEFSPEALEKAVQAAKDDYTLIALFKVGADVDIAEILARN